MTNVTHTAILVVLLCSGPASGKQSGFHGLRVEGAELYTLAPDEAIFSSQKYRWQTVPGDKITGSTAVRNELNQPQPLTVHAEKPGHLFAVLWKWDFGFFGHAPPEARIHLQGWKLVDGHGGSVQGASEPFSPLDLYSRPLEKGQHELELLEYFGQWVIVGFAPASTTNQKTEPVPKVQLVGSRTRHHVYDPGDRVVLESHERIVGTKLFQHGELLSEARGVAFTAPAVPGRYVLKIEFQRSSRLAPLTVGYGPIEQPGWPEGFFPIHFHTGWGYRGLFIPNHHVLHELQTLNMFEMGANTYFTDPAGTRHDIPRMSKLIDALGARRIMALTRYTRHAIRDIENEDTAAKVFLDEINRFAPYAPNVIALHIDDEPKEELLGRFKVIEQAFQESDRHRGEAYGLLYILLGEYTPAFWQEAGSEIRIVRAYPIRKDHRENRTAQIKREQSDYLATCQTVSQEAPLWFVIQSFGAGQKLGRWDPPTATQFRLLANLALARGTKALTYFCWDSSPTGKEDLLAIVDHPYVPRDQELYDEVARTNARISALSSHLSSWNWVKSIEQRSPDFDVQLLEDGQGTQYVWITNWDYARPAGGTVRLQPGAGQTVNVSLPPGGSRILVRRDAVWRDLFPTPGT